MPKKSLILVVEAKFGSETQAKEGSEALHGMVETWREFTTSRHKQNKINILSLEGGVIEPPKETKKDPDQIELPNGGGE